MEKINKTIDNKMKKGLMEKLIEKITANDKLIELILKYIEFFMGGDPCKDIISEISLCLVYDKTEDIKQCIKNVINEYLYEHENKKPK